MSRVGQSRSGGGLIPLDEARSHVLARVGELEAVVVPIAAACGAVLVDDVIVRDPLPPFDNSALDGFAVRSVDVVGADEEHPVRLPVVETVMAGAVPTKRVGPGLAIRIMTGAPMPEGADAIVMVENTRRVAGLPAGPDAVDGPGRASAPGRLPWNGGLGVVPPTAEDEGGTGATTDRSGLRSDGGDGPDEVLVLAASAAGAGVRRKGSDLVPGAVAVSARTQVRAAHVGVLANVGASEVAVVRRPVVGVLSTGDELVEPGVALGPGQIRDSNRPGLLALLREDGFEAVDLGWAPDDYDAIRDAIIGGVETCDAIVTSGGVSMGDVDLVRVVLDEIGEMRWMQLAVKPAKPFAFGTVARVEGTGAVPVFGLPGNPVSSIVSYELLARPALRKMAGFTQLHRPTVVAVADVGFERRRDGKMHFVRVTCTYEDDGSYHVRPSGGQDSHQLAAMAAANGLAVLPDGEGIETGNGVEVIVLR